MAQIVSPAAIPGIRPARGDPLQKDHRDPQISNSHQLQPARHHRSMDAA
ncbi:hypothetical protein [Tatumella ptyseos]|nr:hypothetical protein [Tatumella ptyseos]